MDDQDWQQIIKLPSLILGYDVIGLMPGKTHKFKVRLEDVYGYPGEFTPEVTFITPTAGRTFVRNIQFFIIFFLVCLFLSKRLLLKQNFVKKIIKVQNFF